jgi:phage baseplate assembly protein W
MPYKNLVIQPTNYSPTVSNQTSQFYKGFSTIDDSKINPKIYDYDLIKQDILNMFQTRQGERVMHPDFGTIIWDVIYDPLTEQLKELVVNDVTRILNFDPRVTPISINLLEQPYGLLLESTLQYVGTDQTDTLRLSFDKEVGLVQQQ